MRLVVQSAPHGVHPAIDVAVAHALLRRASDGDIGPTVRISRPRTRTVAFGRSDLRRPGFAAAADLCRDVGFSPIVRGAGGRVAAYTEDAIVIDHVSPDPVPGAQMRQRFKDYGQLIADVLVGVGVDARVGEVEGEYCPGEYSVNARSAVKLVGTAQRVVRNAWLFSAVVVVGGAPELRALLPTVHDHLELPFTPTSVGSISEERADLGVEEIEQAFATAYRRAGATDSGLLERATLDRAWTVQPQHVVEQKLRDR